MPSHRTTIAVLFNALAALIVIFLLGMVILRLANPASSSLLFGQPGAWPRF